MFILEGLVQPTALGANKPPKDQLIDIWIRSLARNDGPDLDAEGVTYSMV